MNVGDTVYYTHPNSHGPIGKITWIRETYWSDSSFIDTIYTIETLSGSLIKIYDKNITSKKPR